VRARSATAEEEPVVKKTRKTAAAATKSGKRKAVAPRARLQPPPEPPQAPVAPSLGATLDGAVDSLRRLLGELLEQHVESVTRELVEVRRAVTAGVDGDRVLELIDDLLQRLGALRFTAEPLDVVDPLIHAVVEERHADGVPAGVILEAVRPGFRSGRGLVLAKAAVAVSGG
jgi:hypothetical protein